MSNVSISKPKTKAKSYDLEERTGRFGEIVVGLCLTLNQDAVRKPIISQLVRSATSIGANYMEANAASSKRDFRNKIYLCKKEVQETIHWLRMLIKCEPKLREKIISIQKEAKELTLIFGKILKSLNERS